MCNDSGACSPCASRAVRESSLVLVEQAEREVLVWGPASVEVEARNGFVFTTQAVEQALPQLLRRRTVDLFHKSAFGVGEVIPEIKPEPGRMPARAALKRVVDEQGGVLRSDVYEVTQAIVDLFPRLKPVKGTRQVFLASRIFGDNKTSKLAQERALAGKLDSYSVAGVATEVEQAEVCAPGGCREVQRILKLDLGAVTLCGTDARPEVGVPQAQNPLAGFVVVQMAADVPLFQEKTPMTKPASPSTPADGTSVPVEQADDAPPAGGSDPLAQLQKAAVDQGRRIEQLEQRLAEVAGSPRNTPDEKQVEQEAEGEEKPDEADDKEKDTMKPGDKPQEKKPDDKPVEQAQPAADAAAPAWFTGFVNTQLPQIVEQAVKAHMPAAPAAVEQAQTTTTGAPAAPAGRPSIAATPKPAAPANGSDGAQAGQKKSAEAILVEAAESGDPAAFQNAWREHYPALRQQLRGGSPKVI